jgi:hypothetical protein
MTIQEEMKSEPVQDIKGKSSQVIEKNPDPMVQQESESVIESTYTLQDATLLISTGTKYLTMGLYEEAADSLALAVEIQVGHLGQYAIEVAPSFHLYGKALLQAAIQKNTVLGEKAEPLEPVEPRESIDLLTKVPQKTVDDLYFKKMNQKMKYWMIKVKIYKNWKNHLLMI